MSQRQPSSTGKKKTKVKVEGRDEGKGRKKVKDVSKHTFFISNSQMRLKLFAKNVRQMQQWITALERTANSSYWTGSNRFGSFAPIRLNVAAQWLVDGVCPFQNLKGKPY